MPSVREMILAKQEKKENKRLILKDVNHDLIVALLAIPIYGKEARDEEILSVIINAGANNKRNEQLRLMRNRYNQMVKDKKIKKSKSGDVTDSDGYLVLVPRT